MSAMMSLPEKQTCYIFEATSIFFLIKKKKHQQKKSNSTNVVDFYLLHHNYIFFSILVQNLNHPLYKQFRMFHICTRTRNTEKKLYMRRLSAKNAIKTNWFGCCCYWLLAASRGISVTLFTHIYCFCIINANGNKLLYFICTKIQKKKYIEIKCNHIEIIYGELM